MDKLEIGDGLATEDIVRKSLLGILKGDEVWILEDYSQSHGKVMK